MICHMKRPLAKTFGLVIEGEYSAPLPGSAEILQEYREHGAVLLRGFPFTKEKMVDFSDQCCASFSNYAGGGLRFRSLDRISMGANGTLLSTTGGTQAFDLPLHG